MMRGSRRDAATCGSSEEELLLLLLLLVLGLVPVQGRVLAGEHKRVNYRHPSRHVPEKRSIEEGGRT